MKITRPKGREKGADRKQGSSEGRFSRFANG
jgi:hypothetical protein